MNPKTAKQFPAAIIAAAQEAQKETGCLTSVTLAQWALESGYGRHLAAKNNFFGMKWFHGCKYAFETRITRECKNGRWYTTPAKFQSFPTVAIAFAEHGKLLMKFNGPYKKALPFAKEWRKFIEAIGPIYATDPKYTQNLIKIVESYQLYDFDRV